MRAHTRCACEGGRSGYLTWHYSFLLLSFFLSFGANITRTHTRCACEGGRSVVVATKLGIIVGANVVRGQTYWRLNLALFFLFSFFFLPHTFLPLTSKSEGDQRTRVKRRDKALR